MSFDYIENLPMNEILSLYDDVIEDNTLKADCFNKVQCSNGRIGYTMLFGDCGARNTKSYNYTENGFGWCTNYYEWIWHVCRVYGHGVSAYTENNIQWNNVYTGTFAQDCRNRGGTLAGNYICKLN